MFKFIGRMKAKRKAAEYRRGFEYAAGVLLDGYPGGEVGSVEYLEGNVELSKRFGRYDDFDSGVEAAIAKHEGGCYFTADGTLLNADGTRSIFDDVDN